MSYGNYLAECVEQLDACSHKYSEDIICGSNAQFGTAHCQYLSIDEHTYNCQTDSYRWLMSALDKGEIYQVQATTDSENEPRYKYYDGKWPKEYTEKQRQQTQEEREKYDTGDGDTTRQTYPRKPYSLQSPPPHGLFADATAAFLRTHDKVKLLLKIHVPPPDPNPDPDSPPPQLLPIFAGDGAHPQDQRPAAQENRSGC